MVAASRVDKKQNCDYCMPSKNKRLRAPDVRNHFDDINIPEGLVSINDLDWQQVVPPDQFLAGPADDDMGGFYGLEEISDVECVWLGDETTGKTCLFKVHHNQ